MKKTAAIKLCISTSIVLAISIIAILSIVYSSPPFKFLYGKRPAVHERLNHSTMRVYSFPAAYEDTCSEASLELASLGFSDDTSRPRHPNHERRFVKHDRTSLTYVTMLNRRFSAKSTNRNFIYEAVPGWVSVEIRKFSESKFQRHLNRWFPRKPLPPDPNIGRIVYF
jgi:hypothetical protein